MLAVKPVFDVKRFSRTGCKMCVFCFRVILPCHFLNLTDFDLCYNHIMFGMDWSNRLGFGFLCSLHYIKPRKQTNNNNNSHSFTGKRCKVLPGFPNWLPSWRPTVFSCFPAPPSSCSYRIWSLGCRAKLPSSRWFRASIRSWLPC